MPHPALKDLESDDFQAQFIAAPSPVAVHRMLEKSPGVQRVQAALQEGTLSESELQEFAEKLLQDFRRGERFRHELPLAALAVALQGDGRPSADEYIRKLASLQLAEMSTCIRVAREALGRRTSVSAVGAITGQHPPVDLDPRGSGVPSTKGVL